MHAGGAPSSKPVIALLSASVLAALDGTPELMALLDPRSDGAVAFVDACAQVWAAPEGVGHQTSLYKSFAFTTRQTRV